LLASRPTPNLEDVFPQCVGNKFRESCKHKNVGQETGMKATTWKMCIDLRILTP